MRLALFALLLKLCLPSLAFADKAIMEGTSASRYTIKVDTANARVLVSTTAYRGGITDVGLYVSSNVVISTDTRTQHIVMYATGTVHVGTMSATYVRADAVSVSSAVRAAYVAVSDTISVSSAVRAAYASFSSPISVNGAVVPSTSPTSSGLSTAHSTGTTFGFTGSTTETSFSVCYATVAITVSANGANVAVWYSGSVHNSGAGGGCLVSFLHNGAFPTNYSAARGHGVGISHSANAPDRASFYTVIQGVSAGTNNFCLTLAALSATCNISATSYTYPEFGAMELK